MPNRIHRAMKRTKKGITGMLMSVLFLFSACVFSSCSGTADSDEEALAVIAPKDELAIAPSKEKLPGTVIQNEDFVSRHDEDECFNITPDFIADNSDFIILKFNKTTSSFIIYEGNIYSIGTCFGGYGITSMALADMNMDNQYELYYTFSWGSGIHRSQIGYFDPVSKEVTVFDYAFWNGDMMLTVNESGDLCVDRAALSIDSFVDFTVKAQERIGTIVFDEGEIKLHGG